MHEDGRGRVVPLPPAASTLIMGPWGRGAVGPWGLIESGAPSPMICVPRQLYALSPPHTVRRGSPINVPSSLS